MISKEQAFRELFEAVGRPMAADEYSDEGHNQVMHLPRWLAQQAAELYAGRVNRTGQTIDHHCGIVLARPENAAVGYRDGTFCIGIYEALINSTLEVVFWIFRSPHFMKGLGAASSMQGTQPQFLVPPGRNWVERMLRGLPPNDEDFFKIGCREREQAAGQMVIEVLSFVVLHEFQHILQGHVSYLEETAGMAFVSEDDVFNDTLPPPVRTILRVFEYESDWGAYREMLTGRSLEKADGLSVSRYRSAMKRMRQVAPFVALYIFTFEWAAKANLSPATHPDPLRRMHALWRRVNAEADNVRAALAHLKIDLVGIAKAVGQPPLLGIFNDQLNQGIKQIIEEEYVLADNALKQARVLGFPSLASGERTGTHE
jgi:hypothetical protein